MSNSAADFFESYYTEKIWEMIPAIYRHEDSIADNPGVLRSLVEIIAGQAAVLRRSHDRLWEDQYIDTCDDWVIPYIADLLATRLVSPLNVRGRRTDVAKTIYYRRRKGTVGILEELISDITGWEGVLVEQFLCLGRSRHRLDPEPQKFQKVFTKTMPGGWANIRSARSVDLVGGPFDEYCYTPDVRNHKGITGIRNIPKVAFYLYRLPAFTIIDSTPFAVEKGKKYTFTPTGGDLPLFFPRKRPESWENNNILKEWQIPTPVSCNALDFLLKHDEKDKILPGIFRIAVKYADTDEKWTEIKREEIVAANLNDWSVVTDGAKVAVDAEAGRFMFVNFDKAPAMVKVSYCYGFSSTIGAGPYSRLRVESIEPDVMITEPDSITSIKLPNNGTTEIRNSFTYNYIGNKASLKNMRIQAANGEVPYINLSDDWILDTASGSAASVENAVLVLDGFWIGSDDDHAIILEGDYKKVILCNCTIDPGNHYKAHENGKKVLALPIHIKGHVEKLQIERSIIGPIEIVDKGLLDALEIRDSILQSSQYNFPDTHINFDRVTLLGKLNGHTLNASNSFFYGEVIILNEQEGCFRFSGAPAGSILPKKYKSVELSTAKYYYTSQQFGNPGYAQMLSSAPEEVLRGAENGAEIGAFNSLINAVKSDNLKTKVNEYLPFGLIPIFIYQT